MNSIKEMSKNIQVWEMQLKRALGRVRRAAMEREPGIDGILVTVGLCIIALLLCVVMKDSLKTFVETIVAAMTEEAKEVLAGVTP